MEREDAKIRADLVAMKACMNDAIDLVVLRTKGDLGADVYSPNEIHSILASAFDKDEGVTLEMIKQAFKVKDSLIGGSPDSIHKKQEITALRAYVNFVYDRLAYHASDRHYLFSDKHGGNHAEFLVASQRFHETVQAFLQLPRKASGSFDYLALTHLVEEFLEEGEDSKGWRDSLKIINALQAYLSSGQKDIIDIRQFPFVMEQLGDVFMSYMEFQKFLRTELVKGDAGYDDIFFKDISVALTFPGLLKSLVKDPNVFLDGQLQILHNVQEGLLRLLRKGVENAPNQKLNQVYVADLIDTFEEIGAMPSYTQAKTLKTMMPKFFGRWLSKKKCEGDACISDVVTLENVDYLKELVNEWNERQEWVNQWSTMPPRAQVTVGTTPMASINLTRFRSAVNKMKYLHWDDYVVIGSPEINYKDLTIFNKIYTLVTIFTRPMNSNPTTDIPIHTYITREQTQELFEWFRELGVELRIIDPRSETSGKTAFLEINLFMPSSKNSDKLEFVEMLEYLEISISTGLRSVNLVEEVFKTCQESTLDVFELPRLTADCVRPKMKRVLDQHLFPSLPHFRDYLKTPDADLDITLNYIERAARQGLIVEQPMETDTFRMLSSIAMYVESIFLRFDEDGSNSINRAELTELLAHVRPVLRKLIEDALADDPGTLNTLKGWFPNFEDDILTYMVYKREVPAVLTVETNPGLGEGIPLVAFKTLKDWSNAMPTWLVGDANIKREDIIFVVSGLSYFNRTKRLKSLRRIFYENDFLFSKGLSNPDDEVFRLIKTELQCSLKIGDEVKQWLLDNQKNYWSAYDINNDNWTQDVTYKMLELLFEDKKLGHLCGLPYISTMESVRKRSIMGVPVPITERVPTIREYQDLMQYLSCPTVNGAYMGCEFVYEEYH